MERNFLIKLAYDGAAYHGWQIQENALTVQQVFQEALGKITGLSEDIKACSRDVYKRQWQSVMARQREAPCGRRCSSGAISRKRSYKSEKVSRAQRA